MKPITRLENFLAKIAGLPNANLTPRTRKEYFLNAIAAHGGGGGGQTTVLYWGGEDGDYLYRDADQHVRAARNLEEFTAFMEECGQEFIVQSNEGLHYPVAIFGVGPQAMAVLGKTTPPNMTTTFVTAVFYRMA